MTRILTLYGGPGTGKSTTAARVFTMFKELGVSVEMAREYVKRWAWEGRQISGFDEYYFVGKQIREESHLFNKVDYIVSDKPLVMDIYYARKYASPTIAKGIEGAVTSFYQAAAEHGHRHFHLFLRRSKTYDPRGRYEDEQTALAMDGEIRLLLEELRYPYEECDTDDQSVVTYCERMLQQ